MRSQACTRDPPTAPHTRRCIPPTRQNHLQTIAAPINQAQSNRERAPPMQPHARPTLGHHVTNRPPTYRLFQPLPWRRLYTYLPIISPSPAPHRSPAFHCQAKRPSRSFLAAERSEACTPLPSCVSSPWVSSGSPTSTMRLRSATRSTQRPSPLRVACRLRRPRRSPRARSSTSTGTRTAMSCFPTATMV
jgi:hypothetical protein